MKITYSQSKGHRIKKGSVKVEWMSHRVSTYCDLTIIEGTEIVENIWWCEDLNKWCNHAGTMGNSFSSHNHNINNLKQAIRHIKKHKELKKGTLMRLGSNFVGYYIYILI